MNRIKFGIIGCGMIAKWHAKALSAVEETELVAVCDISPEAAQAFAQEYNIKAFTECQEMLMSKEIDAVSVCVPSGFHGRYVIAAASAGKHILCEKPLEVKKEVMDQIIEAVNENNVKLEVVFQSRVKNGLKTAKNMLDSGELGKILIVECQYRGYRSPEYYASADWRGTKAIDGGGCLMNQGVHVIDTMCWLVGDVETVYGQVDTMMRAIEVEDTAMALLQFANGARGVLMGTTLSNVPEKGPEGERLRIECEKGTIVYADGIANLYLRKTEGVEEIPLEINSEQVVSSAEDPASLDLEGHFTLVKDLAISILQEKPVYISGESARKSVDLVLAVYESSETGKKIFL